MVQSRLLSMCSDFSPPLHSSLSIFSTELQLSDTFILTSLARNGVSWRPSFWLHCSPRMLVVFLFWQPAGIPIWEKLVKSCHFFPPRLPVLCGSGEVLGVMAWRRRILSQENWGAGVIRAPKSSGQRYQSGSLVQLYTKGLGNSTLHATQ